MRSRSVSLFPTITTPSIETAAHKLRSRVKRRRLGGKHNTRQLKLLETAAREFGGSLLGQSANSHAKVARPLNTRRPIHLVMKAKSAIGSRSMLAPANASVIRRLLNRLATKHGVKVYRYANGGNHLHMLVKIHNREMFKNFLRVASGLIARHVLRAGRGPAANPEASRNVQKRHLRTGPRNESVKREAFWSQRPYTRIATWGREWRNLVNYFRLNNLEAIGFVNHQPRGRGSASKRLHFMSLPVDSA